MTALRELPMLPTAPGPAGDEAPDPRHGSDERAAPDGARYRVDGMDCAACAQTVQKVVAALDGVRAASVSFGNATLTVEGDVAPDRVSAAVARAGYRAAPVARRRGDPAGPVWRRDARAL